MEILEFKNLPSTDTPINSENLNKVQQNVEDVFDGNVAIGSIVVDGIRSKNMFDKNNVTLSKIILRSTGDTSTNASYCTTDYIPVISGMKLKFKGFNQYYNAFYDENKNYIGYTDVLNPMVVIDGAKYMRTSLLIANLDTAQIEKGEVETEYSDFKKYGYNSIESMGNVVVDDIECKNKLDEDNPTNSDITWSGSGSIHYFTASETWKTLEWLFRVKKGEQYAFSYKARNSESIYLYIAEIDTSGTVLRAIVSDGTNIINKFTIENSGILRIRFMNSAIVTNVLFEELMLEKGLIKTKYITHKKIGYSSRESMKNIIVDNIISKNIFDGHLEYGSLNNNTGEEVELTTGIRSGFVKVEPNTTYTIQNDKNYSQHIIEYTSDKTFVKRIANSVNPFTFTTSSTTEYIRFRGSTGETDLSTKWQIELGSIATEITPYKEFDNTVNIITGEETPTNEYVDGKRVFMQKIDFGALPNATTKRVETTISSSNRLIRFYSMATASNYATILPAVSASDTTKNIACGIDLSTTNYTLEITTGVDRSSWTGTFEIYYTKN